MKVIDSSALKIRAGAPVVLSAHTSKHLLAKHGIPVTQSFLATTVSESVRMADDLGYPVVLKIESPDVSHKTDVGGVRLALSSADEVARAFVEVVRSVETSRPDARIEGVCIEECVTGGVEVIVGMERDPVFGPVVIFGLGGVFVEVLDDVSVRAAPVSDADVGEMLKEIKGWKVLQGYRSSGPADIAALAGIIRSVSALAELDERIQEVDLNPVLVRRAGSGAVVVDARVVSW